MNELVKKYNCDEYFEDYYSKGLFHPRECQELYSHQNIKKNAEILIIGQVYDDHDFLICYRLNFTGIWGKSNYDGSFQKISDTLKEFTEGWYQIDYNYWVSMTSKKIWSEIESYYILNKEKYNWKVKYLLIFIEKGKQHQISNIFFLKASKIHLQITINNGFIKRPFENTVDLFFDEKSDKYISYFKFSFFKEHNSVKYEINQIDEMIEYIHKWIIKDNTK